MKIVLRVFLFYINRSSICWCDFLFYKIDRVFVVRWMKRGGIFSRDRIKRNKIVLYVITRLTINIVLNIWFINVYVNRVKERRLSAGFVHNMLMNLFICVIVGKYCERHLTRDLLGDTQYLLGDTHFVWKKRCFYCRDRDINTLSKWDE